MIEEEHLITILRFTTSDDPLASFSAVCTLQWESKHIVWIKALMGSLTRVQLREFIQYLLDHDIHLVKCIRTNGSLPFATKIIDTYCEIDVVSQKERLARYLRS